MRVPQTDGTCDPEKFKSQAAALKLDIFVLDFAARDPRTPCPAKAIVADIVRMRSAPSICSPIHSGAGIP